jgi:hypothetical protein
MSHTISDQIFSGLNAGSKIRFVTAADPAHDIRVDANRAIRVQHLSNSSGKVDTINRIPVWSPLCSQGEATGLNTG